MEIEGWNTFEFRIEVLVSMFDPLDWFEAARVRLIDKATK